MKTSHWTKRCYSRELRLFIALSALFFGLLVSFYSNAEHAEPQAKTPGNTSVIVEKQTNENLITKTTLSNTSYWRFLHPYHATYSVISEGDVLGQATRELSKKDNNWTLSTFAKIKKLFLTLKSSESTKFNINFDKIFGVSFTSKTKMTFKKTKRMNQEFDWKNMIENGNRDKRKWQLPIEHPIYDRVSHLVQLRSDLLKGETEFQYPVSYKGKHLQYKYLEAANQIISTKMGDFKARQFVRQKSDGEKFIVWLAPELNFFPIKIAQYETDKPDITLLLNKLEYINPTASLDTN